MTTYVRIPTAAELYQQLSLILGPWSGVAHYQLTEHRYDPLIFSLMFGPETLAYMLFGMAALKSGFLTGQWTDEQYQRAAIVGFAIAIPCLPAARLADLQRAASASLPCSPFRWRRRC